MMECICERCGYRTDRTANIRNHLSRKIPCDDINNCGKSCTKLRKDFEKDTSDYQFICEPCGLKFKTRQGKNYHLRTSCKHKTDPDEHEECTRLKEENARLKEQLAKLSSERDNGSTINNITNNVTNTANITIVYDFGKENIEYVKNNPLFLDECMRDVPVGLRNVVKKIYFDADHPENKTVAMKNFKLNQLMVREGGEWHQRHAHETIPKMVKKGRNILQEHYITGEVYNKTNDDEETEVDPKMEYFNDLNIPTTNAYKKAVSMVKSEIGNYNFKDVKIEQ
jgi:transcriptional regulator